MDKPKNQTLKITMGDEVHEMKLVPVYRINNVKSEAFRTQYPDYDENIALSELLTDDVISKYKYVSQFDDVSFDLNNLTFTVDFANDQKFRERHLSAVSIKMEIRQPNYYTLPTKEETKEQIEGTNQDYRIEFIIFAIDTIFNNRKNNQFFLDRYKFEPSNVFQYLSIYEILLSVLISTESYQKEAKELAEYIDDLLNPTDNIDDVRNTKGGFNVSRDIVRLSLNQALTPAQLKRRDDILKDYARRGQSDMIWTEKDTLSGIGGGVMILKIMLGFACILFHKSKDHGTVESLTGNPAQMELFRDQDAIVRTSKIRFKVNDFVNEFITGGKKDGKAKNNFRSEVLKFSTKRVFSIMNGKVGTVPLWNVTFDGLDYMEIQLSPAFMNAAKRDFLNIDKSIFKKLGSRDFDWKLYIFINSQQGNTIKVGRKKLKSMIAQKMESNRFQKYLFEAATKFYEFGYIKKFDTEGDDLIITKK